MHLLIPFQPRSGHISVQKGVLMVVSARTKCIWHRSNQTLMHSTTAPRDLKCILTKSSSTTGYISSVISACLQCILDPDGCKKNCISIAVSAGRNSFPPMLGIHSTPVRQDLKVHFDNSPNTTGCISCHFGLLAMHSWIQTDVKNCISIAVSARQKMYSQRVRCIQTISKVH